MGQGFGFHKQSTEGRSSPAKGDGDFWVDRHNSSIGMQADYGRSHSRIGCSNTRTGPRHCASRLFDCKRRILQFSEVIGN